MVTPVDDWVFTYDYALESLLQHFQTHSLKGFGVDGMDAGGEVVDDGVPFLLAVLLHRGRYDSAVGNLKFQISNLE